MLLTGQSAPSFSLPDAGMQTVSLSSYKGRKNVVLYFYPRDDTPGCTLEAIEFSDHEAQFGHSVLINHFFANESDFDTPVIDRRASVQKRNLGPLKPDSESTWEQRHERGLGKPDEAGGRIAAGIAGANRVALDDGFQTSKLRKSDDGLFHPEIRFTTCKTSCKLLEAHFYNNLVEIFVQLHRCDHAGIHATIDQWGFPGLNSRHLIECDLDFRPHRFVIGPQKPRGGCCSDDRENQNPSDTALAGVADNSVVLLLVLIGHWFFGRGRLQII